MGPISHIGDPSSIFSIFLLAFVAPADSLRWPSVARHGLRGVWVAIDDAMGYIGQRMGKGQRNMIHRCTRHPESMGNALGSCQTCQLLGREVRNGTRTWQRTRAQPDYMAQVGKSVSVPAAHLNKCVLVRTSRTGSCIPHRSVKRQAAVIPI